MASWASIAKAAPPPPTVTEAQQEEPAVLTRKAVVDANAIIGGLSLQLLADRYFTIQEVLDEIRDKQSRQFLQMLPYTIEVLEPDEDSVKAVVRFARETGDIHALSATDIKLLALAHSLEIAAHGAQHLREHPVKPRTSSRHRSRGKGLPGWDHVPNADSWKAIDEIDDEQQPDGAASRIMAQVQALDLSSGVEGAALPELSLQPAAATTADETESAGNGLAAHNGTIAAPAHTAEPASTATAVAQSTSNEPAQQDTVTANATQASQPSTDAAQPSEDWSEGEDEDDGEWCVAAKSKNSARRKQRRERRWQERQQHQQQQQQQPQHVSSGPVATAKAAVSTAGATATGDAAAAHTSAAESAPVAEEPTHAAADNDHPQHQGSGDEEEYDSEGSGSYEDDHSEDVDEHQEEFSEDITITETGGETVSVSGTHDTAAEFTPNTTSTVVSVTADFAMQNVLMQMGLRLVTRDGMQITRLTRWAVRCSACFFVTKEAGRLFCPRCGNMTMDRVEITVGPDGTEFFGVRKKHVLKGTRYSLPNPKGGRNAKNPVLREDQLLRLQGQARKKPAAEIDPFDPEFGMDTFAQQAHPMYKKGAQVVVTNWKNNPNRVRKHSSSKRK